MFQFDPDVRTKVEQWYHLPVVLATIFVLVGIHVFHWKQVLVIAILIDFLVALMRWFVVYSCEVLYLTIGHSLVLWIWSLGTLLYFCLRGDWFLGLVPIVYYVLLGSIFSIPGIVLIDGLITYASKTNPKTRAAGVFNRRFLASNK